jgi:polysaccharide transporter, PST family
MSESQAPASNTDDGRFGSALKWSFAMKWGRQATTAAVRLVLMALLAVEDFGLVGMAWLYIMFLEMILDQGFGAALIQRKQLDQRHMESVFWLVFAVSIILSGVSILLSDWWGAMNGEPRLGTVICVMSVVLPIQGLTTVQVALLQRDMDFRSLAIRNSLAVLIGGAVGIGLALQNFGVWALVAQQITTALCALVLLWRLSDWRPRLRFSWTAMKELLGFSTGNFIAKVGVFAGNRADEILIGLFFGAFAVGLYRSAMGLMSMIVDLGTRAIGAASFPQFARSQGDFVKLRVDIGFSVWLSATLMMPALGLLAAVSDALMDTLGDRWSGAAVVLQVLCVVGVGQSITNLLAPVLQGLGKARYLAIVVWGTTLLSNLAYVSAGFAAQGLDETLQPLIIAFARGGLFLFIFLPMTLIILRSVSGYGFRDFLGAIRSAAPAGLFAFGAVFGIAALPQAESLPPFVLLVCEGFVGGAVAAAILIGTDARLRGWIQQRLGRRSIA